MEFAKLNDAMLNMGAVNSPSELQGTLCGRLACGKKLLRDHWLDVALEFLMLEKDQLSDEQKALMLKIFDFTKLETTNENLSFSIILPDKQASLERRTEELGLWCRGFLHGVGASGISGEDNLSADAADALRDIAQISQVELDEDDDENENYLEQVIEYVQVAVLTIYSEFNHVEDKNQTIH